MTATERNTHGRRRGIMMVRLVRVLVLAVVVFGIAGIGSVSAETFKNGKSALPSMSTSASARTSAERHPGLVRAR